MSPGARITAALRQAGAMLLGPQRAGFNLPALVCWCVAAWAVFKAAQRLFDKTTAFRALLLFSVLPVFFLTGAIFSPMTVLLSGWALLLCLMTFTLRWERKAAATVCALAVAIFWWPGGWMPWVRLDAGAPALVMPLFFLVLQLALVTPAPLIALGQYFALRWRTDERRGPAGAAAICAAVAAICVFGACVAGGLGMTASGAIWLPLLPCIATEMQRPGNPQGRFWGPTIYGCVICYGVYFYWLALAG
jgi:hypothetical protein